MRRTRKITLEELIKENKDMLLNDKKELEKIEKRLEEKHVKNL
ncbi:hypothetical protein CathTA2_2326 [Caldalkalibacillus thermarum TA2.A1]|uniref:FbpB family small basic protein n=1 Tax=Caldalkalibacillus thermarum (strain TA2.A1) TaxID=986075 RepID=F5L921_CALTT|nr:FbpB family small basic protein [Caldalkalibacillus thermarum]EGL82195.1 hypothetical protein CathTA2_2326 [Caldalkalibacillus thermarum TA2.A1]QZT33093.1 FbpB family small basic protein [Caldalkalibacillus thermarum TA2.A1]GGK35833.1 hypothetical protein GCM10010965_30980 [Caldalkalibacillus thermarum]